jgi:hypothetical protein
LGVQVLEAADHPVYAMEGSSWLRAAAFEWVDGRVKLLDEAADLQFTSVAEFDSMLALAGYGLEPEKPEPGDELVVWLSWHRQGPPLARDYTVFVHLLDGTGERVAQGDGVPGYLGPLPTSLWLPGVSVLDRHVVVLPADLPAGQYSLMIGWYDPETGERLHLASGDDSLNLAQLTVR